MGTFQGLRAGTLQTPGKCRKRMSYFFSEVRDNLGQQKPHRCAIHVQHSSGQSSKRNTTETELASNSETAPVLFPEISLKTREETRIINKVMNHLRFFALMDVEVCDAVIRSLQSELSLVKRSHGVAKRLRCHSTQSGPNDDDSNDLQRKDVCHRLVRCPERDAMFWVSLIVSSKARLMGFTI